MTAISAENQNFILSVNNQEPLLFTYSLTKISETLERLQLHEFNEKAILNFDSLKYMLLETHYTAELEVYFQQLVDESTKSWRTTASKDFPSQKLMIVTTKVSPIFSL